MHLESLSTELAPPTRTAGCLFCSKPVQKCAGKFSAFRRIYHLFVVAFILSAFSGATQGASGEESATRGGSAARPLVWIFTDMSDSTLPGPNHQGTLNDPDDISAMAGYLLMANEFDTRGIVVASTHREAHKANPNQAEWAHEKFGSAYKQDLPALNQHFGGYPAEIPFIESCLRDTAELFDEQTSYRSLAAYDSILPLLSEIQGLDDGQKLYILCWGSLTEPAILVRHCLQSGNEELLDRVEFVAHWTNSPLHQGTPEAPEDVANCREDASACGYMKKMAAQGKVVYRECGAIGQHGIVAGAPRGREYFDQFKVSELGTIFVQGKFAREHVDHSDAATYWTLLGDYGVGLEDLAPDGTNSAEVELRNEQRFHDSSERIHDTLLARAQCVARSASRPPNVLLIALDDLNDWIGCLGGHPQTLTPNLDRLAGEGILFSNAHCPAPACNPSRGAIFSGRAPNRSGLYDNRQQMREVMPNATLMPQYFRDHGYWAAGSGKLLHYVIDARSWDQYFPEKHTENPFPQTYDPDDRPVSLPRGGPWQYVETDWAALPVTDEEYGGDYAVSSWIGEQLSQEHDQPFFLGCGIYRPHEPWFVPERYFEPFPLESIQLPPGYLANDLDDVPDAGVRMANNRYFPHIQEQGQWRQGVQAYLASVHFADAMLGRVLKALDEGPNANNTIVVLWSDHGWQLGEKEHWQKYTPWRAVTRVPLIVRLPGGVRKAIDQHPTGVGQTCTAPVSLLSLYPTLLELCGLPAKPTNDGPSLLPLLANPAADETDWPHVATTFLAKPGSVAISGSRFRYIRYADGEEELYDIESDPFEWKNLAKNQRYRSALSNLQTRIPQEFADRKSPSVESLTKLKWQTIADGKAPPSKPDGSPFLVYFENRKTEPVELFWMNRQGVPKSYGVIDAGQRKQQQTRPGAVWMLARPDGGDQLGYFIVDDRTARAIIPK